MKKNWWIIAGSVTAILCLLVIVFNNQRTLYSNLFAPPVKAMNTIRRVIPGGPARYLSQDGDYIVGIGDVSFQNDDSALYLYDTNGTLTNINDDTYTTIDVQDSGTICRSTVLGDYVTWLQTTEDCEMYVFKAYQISTQNSFSICLTSGEYYDREGNKIVYESYNGSYSDIALYDLSTRSNTIICSAAKDQIFPKISENIIVWEDYRNDNDSDVYMYNLTTQQETAVANGNEFARMPQTNGSMIAYQIKTQSSSTLCLYQISNSTTTSIGPYNTFFWLYDMNDTHCVYKAGDNLMLVDLITKQPQIVDSYNAEWEWNVLLGDTQLAYCVNDSNDHYFMGDVYGFDLVYQNNYTIRSQGDTYWEINMNQSTDQLVMCSIASGQDPDEWDVSLVQLP
jgi:beta propeller repeat protein